MSDPLDPQDRPLRNPPGTRRTRGPRAAAREATREAAREAKEPGAPAAPPKAAAADGLKTVVAQKKSEEKAEAGPVRGMVCRRCGKYHDITHRAIGSNFECKCGAELLVPPIRENLFTQPASVTMRLRDLYRRRALALAGMLIAFPACILLISAALYLLGTEGSYFTGTCAGLASIAFLAGAVIATNEWRRTSAEVAAEELDND